LQNIRKIEHEGIICEISKEYVKVRITQKSACSECHAKSACSLSDSKEKIIEINNSTGNYAMGEKVIITGDSSIGLKAVFYAFAIPLVIIIAVLILSVHILASETMSALITLFSLSAYFLILYVFRKNLKNKFVFSLKKT